MALVVGAVLSVSLSMGATGRPKVANPHWKGDACAACHLIENGKPLPITVVQADDLCLKCHDGEKASAEFHPVGRGFESPGLKKPDWPLVEERLACLTCHDMKAGCSVKATRPNVNRMFLRNFSLARGKSNPFCLNCHQSGAYQKLNPHVMVLNEKKEVIEEKCLFCHSKPLDRNAVSRTGNPSLKSSQATLCRDCHPQHKDPMQQGHLGLKLSPEMQAHIYAREVMGLSARLSPDLLKQTTAAGLKPLKMVPGKDGAIECSTCHNPHQSGVFPQDSVLSYRAMRLTSDGRMVSPVRGQQWCAHCHDF